MEREKRYIPVTVRFDAEGKMRPIELEFDEAHRYRIDRITDVRRAACQSVGGVGDRYTCLIRGQERYLWFEKAPPCSAPVRNPRRSRKSKNNSLSISIAFTVDEIDVWHTGSSGHTLSLSGFTSLCALCLGKLFA